MRPLRSEAFRARTWEAFRRQRRGLRRKYSRRSCSAIDVRVSCMRKDAGRDLIRDGSRTKLRCFSFGSEGKRITDQRRAVDATELQRLVILNAIACRAAFHFGVLRLDAALLKSVSEPRAVATGSNTQLDS